MKAFHFKPLEMTRRCRFCGRKFVTTCPAKKTCDRPECKAKSAQLIKKQNQQSRDRFAARMRRLRNFHLDEALEDLSVAVLGGGGR